MDQARKHALGSPVENQNLASISLPGAVKKTGVMSVGVSE